jgi:molybdopterin-containing oxidoreductase family iron-sulfur binding subunit
VRAHLVRRLHALESWGDYAAEEGVLGLMQPTMGPVQIDGKAVDGKAAGDVFLSVGRQALGLEAGKGPLRWATFQEFLRDEWQKTAKDYGSTGSFTDFWDTALRRGGVWRIGAAPAISLRPEAGRIQAAAPKLEGSGSHTLMIYPSSRFYDGRGGDLPWLHEVPDGVTQVAWDSWLEIPAETAKQMAITRGDLVKVTSRMAPSSCPRTRPSSFMPAWWRWRWGRDTGTRGPSRSGATPRRAPRARPTS